jgi:hypothetical protein
MLNVPYARLTAVELIVNCVQKVARGQHGSLRCVCRRRVAGTALPSSGKARYECNAASLMLATVAAGNERINWNAFRNYIEYNLLLREAGRIDWLAARRRPPPCLISDG